MSKIKRPGYWADHEYKKSSVRADIALSGWVGWAVLSAVLNTAINIRDRKLVLTMFKTGGRINEVLDLRFEMFEIASSPFDSTKMLLARAVPLSKRWRKIGEELLGNGHKKFITEKVEAYRTFALPVLDSIEPYSDEFLKFVQSKPRGLLFPSPYRSRADIPISTTRAYQIIQDIGLKLDMDLYNHLIRAWRASQLKRERKFKVEDLMEFFQWRDFKTALVYAQEGVWGIAEKMYKTPVRS